MWDYFKLGLRNITHRKLRSWLTMIGVFVGIMAVVGLTSLGDGMQNAIDHEFEKIGTNRIMVMPGGAMMGAPGTDIVTGKLTEEDLKAIKNIKGVEYALGVIQTSVRITYRDETKYAIMFAAPHEPEDVKFMEKVDYFVIEEGRYLNPQDKYKATIGPELAEELFDKEVKLKDKLLIEGKEFEVVGINKKSGNPAHDNKATILYSSAQELLGKGDEYSMISVETKSDVKPSDVKERIEEKLRRLHDVKEDEEDFTVETAEQMIKTFTQVLDIVQVVLSGIAGISLLVGGVGIMNTMYTSVIERTKQIGIMKAVGARNRDVMAIFMIEAGLLGTVGGVIGSLLGYGLGEAVEAIAVYYGIELLRVTFSPGLFLSAVSFSFVIGAVSGAFPARKAALMKPVDALRS
ncbi:MAG: ABC transporter permease [Candidatus Altiarchaeota archaeon]